MNTVAILTAVALAGQIGPGLSTPPKAPEPVERTEGVVYVGDSRMNGMEIHTGRGQQFVIAKDSMGYHYLKGKVPYEIERLKRDNPKITEWTIVSNFGVNDMHDINLYIGFYQNMEKLGFKVVVMSVNPTDGKRSDMNDDIDEFNEALEESGLTYFDMCSHLREVGFDTTDGLHYTKNTDIEIWNELNNYLQGSDEWLCSE